MFNIVESDEDVRNSNVIAESMASLQVKNNIVQYSSNKPPEELRIQDLHSHRQFVRDRKDALYLK